MINTEKAKQFAALHVKGSPLVLYNAWDAGSAKAIGESGAKAVATSSWSVAAAQGYQDGEDLPLDFAEQILGRVVAAINLPVTADFEGGYSENDDELAANVSRLIDLGIVGINFEDRLVKGKGLYGHDRQARRISTIREAAEKKGIPLFINARTDVFLGQTNDLEDAIKRGKAYAAAGASGFFVPGLKDGAQIARIVESSVLPVNIMVMAGVPSTKKLGDLGVARVSYGPIPYIEAMDNLKKATAAVL